MVGMMKKMKLLLLLPVLLSTATQSEQRCQTEHIAVTAPSSRYQQIDNGTVVDNKTGLMWRVCLEGVTGDTCGSGAPLTLNWAEALLYAPKLNAEGGFAGHKDWRLPNIREIATLIELQCVDPAINRNVFPNTPPSQVWTSSPSGFVNHYSWYADFKAGAFTHDVREKAKTIRLVRDGGSR
jgi:hypothetical protein